VLATPRRGAVSRLHPALRCRSAWQRWVVTRCGRGALPLADLLLLEWQWHSGVRIGWAAAWPRAEWARRRYLLIALNAGLTPPMAAWPWLAGDAAVHGSPRRWQDVWRAFRDALQLRQWHELTVRSAPVCLLSATPLANCRTLRIVDWGSAAVQTYFRTAGCERRATPCAARASPAEDVWWRRMRRAFPALRPQRHVPLPASRMHMDVFWREQQVAVEVQGAQHWRACTRFGGATALARRQECDARKRALCRSLGIRLFEITPASDVHATLHALGGLLGVAPRPV